MIEIRILRWGDYPVPQCSHKGPLYERGTRVRVGEGEVRREAEVGGGEDAVLLALRVEEGAVSQEWAQPPKAGTGREVDSL